MPPDAFIPLAEKVGFIGAITDEVIDAVIADVGDLLRHDPHLHIAVNLAASDMSTARILQPLQHKLQAGRISPQQIWLEATEQGSVDIEGARNTLAELRRRGHRIAVDDFGTGYSGLKYLQTLPFDALKIDKSFVAPIGTESPMLHVTDRNIQIGIDLGLVVIAEGVEREDQATYLKEHGVAFAQGWLYSQAVPASEFIAFWSERQARYGASSPI